MFPLFHRVALVCAMRKSGFFLGEKNDFLGEADDFLPKAETGVGRGLRFKAGKQVFVTGKQQLEAMKKRFLTGFFQNNAEQATLFFAYTEKKRNRLRIQKKREDLPGGLLSRFVMIISLFLILRFPMAWQERQLRSELLFLPLSRRFHPQKLSLQSHEN